MRRGTSSAQYFTVHWFSLHSEVSQGHRLVCINKSTGFRGNYPVIFFSSVEVIKTLSKLICSDYTGVDNTAVVIAVGYLFYFL